MRSCWRVLRVTQNRGKRTAGIDGEKWITPNSKMNAALKLSDKKYKAKPLRRVYISKPGTDKKRPLGIPTMHDRAMQALHALLATTDCRNAQLIHVRLASGCVEVRRMHDNMHTVVLVENSLQNGFWKGISRVALIISTMTGFWTAFRWINRL
uniref:Reverse transcriptase N-terminal domain-containing protein n=1 Tax=Candidatus Methanogaster sp. ANME-2c ERB4 TaxID=2759911 RepID=A0A7G9YPR2_9EURY|nr:hypothetical protein CAGMOKBG_00016 [Methanosarcinales archaeon ANME-2c ERB4]